MLLFSVLFVAVSFCACKRKKHYVPNEKVKTEAQTATYMHYRVAHDVSLSSSIQAAATKKDKTGRQYYNNNK